MTKSEIRNSVIARARSARSNPCIEIASAASQPRNDSFELSNLTYPIQYITGSANFMGLELEVKPGVFIPRPETELLVEKIIELVHSPQSTVHRKNSVRGPSTVDRGPSILDLCTGSGNIAITLAKSLKDAKIIASDISNEALAIARSNAESHNCGNIEFIKSDLFDNIDKEPFDVIVSNPPYVSESDWPKLPKDVLCEPRLALYAGRGGLDFYKRIFREAAVFLKKDGYLIMEIGYNQKDSVIDLINGKWDLREIVKDYNGIDRIAVIRKKSG